MIFRLGSRSQGKPFAGVVGDDELAVAARYGLVASERYFFSTSVL